jgi:hypothetical protein
VWKVKPNRDGELFLSPNQEEEVVQGEIITQEVCITIEEDKGWMPTIKEAPFHFLSTIFQNKFSFLKMCQRLMHEGQ